jgi:hypothetical protein
MRLRAIIALLDMQCTQPLCYVPPSRFRFHVTAVTTTQRKALQNRRTRAKCLNVSYAATKMASFMGAERYECLSIEVVFFQECKECHRQRTPPDRIANKDDIVGIHVIGVGRKRRPEVGFLLLFCLLRSGPVFFWIGMKSSNLYDVAANSKVLAHEVNRESLRLFIGFSTATAAIVPASVRVQTPCESD